VPLHWHERAALIAGQIALTRTERASQSKYALAILAATGRLEM
jgi:hypothetical protein